MVKRFYEQPEYADYRNIITFSLSSVSTNVVVFAVKQSDTATDTYPT